MANTVLRKKSQLCFGSKLMAFAALLMSTALGRADGLPVTDGLILDLDASDASSLTLDGDVVKEWRSQVAGAPSLKAAKDVYTAPKFAVGDVHYVTERGQKGLLFSHYDESGKAVYALMSFGDNVQVKGKTFFFVTRQIDEKGNYGVIMGGRPTSYVERLMRDRDVSCKWYDNNSYYGRIMINGVFTKSFASSGGTSRPHVLAAQYGNDTKEWNIEMIGAGYVMANATTANDSATFYNKCVIHEVLMYSGWLSEEQVRSISEYLSAKWLAAVWTGEAGNGNWNDAGNWKYGFKPVNEGTAVFNASATLNLAGDVRCAEITNASSAKVALTFKNDNDVAFAASLRGAIDFVKDGAGTLTTTEAQKYTGATKVLDGTLTLPREVIDYSQIPGLVAHLDASRADTLVTNDKGEVTEWKSATAGGIDFVGANVAYPDGRVDEMAAGKTFEHGNPIRYTDGDGRAAVRFGFDANGNKAGSFITPKDKGPIGPQTFFFVQTQKEKNTGTGLLGRLGGYTFRLCRTKGADCAWYSGGTIVMDESWQNGRKGGTTASTAGDSGRTFEKSGTELPNLLVVRNAAARVFEVIGGQYLYDTASGNPQTGVYNQMDLHEVLLFNGKLTDEQIAAISAQLMDKWGVPRQSDVYLADFLPPDSDIEIDEGATLDLGCHVHAAKSVGGSGTLAFSGTVGVTGTSSVEGSLNVEANGTVDLCGGSLAVGNWTGRAKVVNSSATTGNLIFDTDADVFTDCTVDGNIAVTKKGSGTISLPAGQNASGTTTLGGGALKTDIGSSLARYGRVALHVDASRPETLTLDQDGNVLRWNSPEEGGRYLNNAHSAYPDARFRTAYSHFLTDAMGRPCVRFSYNEDSVHTGAVMAISSELTAQTLFFVNRQHDAKNSGGIIGDRFGYDHRIYRVNTAAQGQPETCGWRAQPVLSSRWLDADHWVSGKKTAEFGTSSGTEGPHVLAVRCLGPTTYEIIGACFLQDVVGGGVQNYSAVYSNADIYEIVAYEGALTDDQICEVSELLVAKWSVKTAEGVVLDNPKALVAGTDVVVKAPTALGLWGTWSFESLTFDVGGAAVCPALSVEGCCDVTETPLAFLDADTVERCKFLLTTGGLTSPFTSVTGLDAGSRVICRPSWAKISNGGGAIFIR